MVPVLFDDDVTGDDAKNSRNGKNDGEFDELVDDSEHSVKYLLQVRSRCVRHTGVLIQAIVALEPD